MIKHIPGPEQGVQQACCKTMSIAEQTRFRRQASGLFPPSQGKRFFPLERLLSREQYLLLEECNRQALSRGFRAYLTGGLVRDLLLGLPPGEDLDIVVEGDAILLAFLVHERVGGRLRFHLPFLAAELRLPGGETIDFTTARQETYPHPASLPLVQSTAFPADLKRRDFTVNAMACGLPGGPNVRLYAGCRERRDLSLRLIRVNHRFSFRDDPLRLLRAVRLEQRLNFRLEGKTEAFFGEAIHKDWLFLLTRPRLNREIMLVFRESSPAAVLQRLSQRGLFPYLFPGLEPDKYTWNVLYSLEKIWLPDQRRGRDYASRTRTFLSALLYSLAEDSRSAIINKLSLSKSAEKAVSQAITRAPLNEKLAGDNKLSPGTLALRLDEEERETILLAAALTSCDESRQRLRVYLEHHRYLRPPVGGKELLGLGLPPGPGLGNIAAALKRAYIDGEARTRKELLNLAKNLQINERH